MMDRERTGIPLALGKWLPFVAFTVVAITVMGFAALPTAGRVAALDGTPAAASAAPAPRTLHDVAYDAESDRIILYGGNVGGPLDDTWSYDLNRRTWTNLMPAIKPPALTTHAMAYDTGSDRVILFGGVKVVGGTFVEEAETWAYDYNTNAWTDMKPSVQPGPRHGHGMAYDEVSDRIIVMGGLIGSGSSAVPYQDTWAYNFTANEWAELTPAVNPRVAHHALAYDAESDRIVHFGGQVGATVLGDATWAYHYNDTWTLMNPDPRPSPRWMHAMAYDGESDRTIMFGGGEAFLGQASDQTWAYDLNTDSWTQMQPAMSPRASTGARMAYDSESDAVVLFGGVQNDTWAYDFNTNSWTPLTSPSAPFLSASAGDLRINLAWQAPSSTGGTPVLSYRIYRGISSGSLSFLEEVGTGLSYVDTNVTFGVTYYYEVSAVTAAGEGVGSNEVPEMPGDFTGPTTLITTVDPTVGFLTALVNGTASDNVAVAMVELSTDGTNWQLASGTSSWSGSVALKCGDNTIFARATDTSGNMAEADNRPSVHRDCPSVIDPILILGIASGVGVVVAIGLLMRRRRNRGKT